MAKVIQLFETFVVRFGVMLVGFTGSGKTTCYEILKHVMTYERVKPNPNPDDVFQKVTYQVLNPKAISMGELYGQVDLATQEWTDGLASKLMRDGAAGTSEDREWTVFDGPVDALWIENMNTVLDDNMTLCLANGQRIKLRPEMRMLFEVNDLRVASPATVSRCGMVYLTQEELGWVPFVKTWLQVRFDTTDPRCPLTEANKDFLWEQFEGTVDIGLDKVRAFPLVEPIKTDNLQLVRSMCNIFEILVFQPTFILKGDDTAVKKDILAIFAFAYTFGLGSGLSDKSKDYFDGTVREQFKAA
jgi:dynein heavy chain